MGLDGISINQLRITPENNSAEANSQVRFSLNSETRAIDGLSSGQRVDPDKEHENEKQQLASGSNQNEEENEEDDEEESLVNEDVIQYDLSRSDKYMLKIDSENNNVLIVEKATKNVLQIISADKLAALVGHLSNSQGSIISKRY